MDSRTRLHAALFGFRDGVPWVSADAFVTRRGRDLLVEGWVGRRAVGILVRHDACGAMRTIWEKLNESAMDVPEIATPV